MDYSNEFMDLTNESPKNEANPEYIEDDSEKIEQQQQPQERPQQQQQVQSSTASMQPSVDRDTLMQMLREAAQNDETLRENIAQVIKPQLPPRKYISVPEEVHKDLRELRNLNVSSLMVDANEDAVENDLLNEYNTRRQELDAYFMQTLRDRLNVRSAKYATCNDELNALQQEINELIEEFDNVWGSEDASKFDRKSYHERVLNTTQMYSQLEAKIHDIVNTQYIASNCLGLKPMYANIPNITIYTNSQGNDALRLSTDDDFDPTINAIHFIGDNCHHEFIRVNSNSLIFNANNNEMSSNERKKRNKNTHSVVHVVNDFGALPLHNVTVTVSNETAPEDDEPENEAGSQEVADEKTADDGENEVEADAEAEAENEGEGEDEDSGKKGRKGRGSGRGRKRKNSSSSSKRPSKRRRKN